MEAASTAEGAEGAERAGDWKRADILFHHGSEKMDWFPLEWPESGGGAVGAAAISIEDYSAGGGDLAIPLETLSDP